MNVSKSLNVPKTSFVTKKKKDGNYANLLEIEVVVLVTIKEISENGDVR